MVARWALDPRLKRFDSFIPCQFYMKYLKKEELYLVKPRFRKTVIAAWNRDEKVPYEVILLSDQEPTLYDIEESKKLNAIHGWE